MTPTASRRRVSLASAHVAAILLVAAAAALVAHRGWHRWLLSAVLVGLPLLVVAWVLSVLAAWLSLGLLVDDDDVGRAHTSRPLPVLELSTAEGWKSVQRSRRARYARGRKVPEEGGALAAATRSLLQLVVRDFVQSWHSPLADGSNRDTEDRGDEAAASAAAAATAFEFPQAVLTTLHEVAGEASARVAQLDLAEVAVGKVLPILTNHLEQFARAELSLGTNKLRSTPSPSLDLSDGREGNLLLASRYADGRLHPALGNASSLDTRPYEEAHLRKLASRIIDALLPPRERDSPAVHLILREILACSLLLPMIDNFSDPDTLNGLLDEKTGAAMEEQRLVGRLRAALDQEQAGRPANQTGETSRRGEAKHRHASREGKGTHAKRSSKRFESFLQSIDESTSLLDLRRTRAQLVQQLRKAQSSTLSSSGARREGRDFSRLRLALDATERRIGTLSAAATSPATPTSPEVNWAAEGNEAGQIELRDVLTSPSAISHLLEWMEPRETAMKVQFWLTVESVKGPLEDVQEGEAEPNSATSSRMDVPAPAADAKEVATLAEDLRLLSDIYYPQIAVRQRYAAEARRFLSLCDPSASSPVSTRDVFLARQSILAAQRQIFEEMLEDDWPKFQRSGLFYKAVDAVRKEREQRSARTRMSFLSTSLPSVGEATRTGHDNATTPEKANSVQAGLSLHGRQELPGKTADAISPRDGALFGEDVEAPKQASQEPRGGGGSTFRSSAMTHKLDFLMGGKGSGTGSDGRAPLFRDALFEEDQEPEEEVETDSEHERPSTLRADRMDVLHHALTSIINDQEQGGRDICSAKDEDRIALTSRLRPDEITSHKGRLPAAPAWLEANGPPHMRPTKPRPTSAARDLRPAFKRSGTSSASASNELLEVDQDRRQIVFGSEWQQESAPSQSSIGRTPPSDTAYPDVEGSNNDTNNTQGPGLSPDVLPAHLPTAIDIQVELERLEAALARLREQYETLSALLRKAELTGASGKESRLLSKGCQSVAREIRELEWQYARLEERRQSSALIAGKTMASIEATSVGREDDGKEFALYVIEVRQLDVHAHDDSDEASNGSGSDVASGWMVQRRYNEFFELHSRLRARFSQVRALEALFPGKRLVGLMHASQIEARRAALDRYLKALLALPCACESAELHVFLSQAHATVPPELLDAAAAAASRANSAAAARSASFPAPSTNGNSLAGSGLVAATTMVRSFLGIADGMDDGLSAAPSMLDVILSRLSPLGFGTGLSGGAGTPGARQIERLGQALEASVMGGPGGRAPAHLSQAQICEAAAAAGLTSSVTAAEQREAFVRPLVDFVIEIFGLHGKNNWLRRQALVMVLQQALGETVERRLREAISSVLGSDSLARHLDSLQSSMWPGGRLRAAGAKRTLTHAQRVRLRDSANHKLTTFVPSVAASLIGRENARRGARRIFAALQNKRLNKHVLYLIVDVVTDELFPDIPT